MRDTWISVQDRLPDEYTNVSIVYEYEGDLRQGIGFYSAESPRWCIHNFDMDLDVIEVVVVYWKLLIPFPEKEGLKSDNKYYQLVEDLKTGRLGLSLVFRAVRTYRRWCKKERRGIET